MGKTSVCTPAAFKQRWGQASHPRTSGLGERTRVRAADKEQNTLPVCRGGGGRTGAVTCVCRPESE